MGLKTSKTILLPKIDKIRDKETKEVLQQVLKIIQKINQTTYGDFSGHEERISDLEP